MAQPNSVIYFVLAVGTAGLISSVLFLYVLDRKRSWPARKIAYKLTAGLTFFSVATLTEVLENTWSVFMLYGVTFPPIQVMFDALVLGFLISGLWDFYSLDLD